MKEHGHEIDLFLERCKWCGRTAHQVERCDGTPGVPHILYLQVKRRSGELMKLLTKWEQS